jgi:hypothetical protein
LILLFWSDCWLDTATPTLAGAARLARDVRYRLVACSGNHPKLWAQHPCNHSKHLGS